MAEDIETIKASGSDSKARIDIVIANYEQLIKEYDQTEKEYAELKIIAANRGAFIDWCAEHHEEILKEYTGFMEAEK